MVAGIAIGTRRALRTSSRVGRSSWDFCGERRVGVMGTTVLRRKARKRRRRRKKLRGQLRGVGVWVLILAF